MTPTFSSISRKRATVVRKSKPVAEAEAYYDSVEADAFYQKIWGGEDLHLGIYDTPDEDIGAASRRTVEAMASQLEGLSPDSDIIDLGAGYGGSARMLAARYGCRVTCLNLSKTQNDLNRALTREAGLSGRITVVHGSFEEIPEPEDTFDVVWSQDAILHSGDRARVMDEVCRVLKPGGRFIFTDPMQSDDCPPGMLQPILERIHLESLGSCAFYRDQLLKRGFTEISITPLTSHLRTHYARVGEELRKRYDEIVELSGRDYVEAMLTGLARWVDGAEKGYLTWGILHFQKRKA